MGKVSSIVCSKVMVWVPVLWMAMTPIPIQRAEKTSQARRSTA